MSEPLIARLLRERGAVTRQFPPREASYGEPSVHLSQAVQERLHTLGTSRLFSHQATAIELALAGKDCMVVTGTGSGKSLCYSVPILEACLGEPMARALIVYPTKALAQDQLGKLENLFEGSHVSVGTYDGDTPKGHRSAVRKGANVVLTNPDMLHTGILPHHETWVKFLRSLRTIVIDEAHTYRGIFGGHVAWTVRRLLRLCDWYGSNPTVIACSATVSNPAELFQGLTGRVATVVDKDGGPAGERTVLLVPPSLTQDDPKSPNVVCGEIAAEMIESGLKVIVFCRARVTAELVQRIARDRLEPVGLADSIASYRGGYTPAERRQIEKRLFSGSLKGIVSTSAMELGVDIGGLDAVVLNGYPGRVSSFWQQIGRAGRAGSRGLGVMVAHDDPLEHYLCTDPERLLATQGEPVVPSLQNKYVAAAQLRCAAHERPLGPNDAALVEVSPAALENEKEAGTLVESSGLVYYAKHSPPASGVNIRGSSGGQVALVCGAEVIGDMEHWRALQWAHPGAVYLHQARTYVVQELDLVRAQAVLTEDNPDHYTVPNVSGLIEPGAVVATKQFGDFSADLAAMRVTTSVSGYRKVSLKGQVTLEEVGLNLPPLSIDTVGLRFDLPFGIEVAADEEVLSAVQGLERLLGALASAIAGCDKADIATSWYAVSPDRMRSAVFVYDAAAGGLGLCEVLFSDLAELVGACHRVAADCSCADGCPLCVMGTSHGTVGGLVSRKNALGLLSRMVASLGSP